MSEELKKLLQQSHEGITIFFFFWKPVPCIIMDEKEYDEWLSDMEEAGIIEPTVGEYDDYDSYMDDVTINKTSDNPQTGNLTHAYY